MSYIERFITLWIVEHGGEWPDWGHGPEGPDIKQFVTAVAIRNLASQITDKNIQGQFKNLAGEVIQSSIKNLSSKEFKG